MAVTLAEKHRRAGTAVALHGVWRREMVFAEARMADPVEALVLDLLEWIGPVPRPYGEVLEAWRTSCPRLPVWEEANAMGLLAREHRAGVGAFVSVSAAGRSYLAQRRPRLESGVERR